MYLFFIYQIELKCKKFSKVSNMECKIILNVSKVDFDFIES